MEVVNQSKKTILATDLKLCNSVLDKFLGLLRKSNPRSLMFKTRLGMHTLLMKENIDILVLDKSNKVVKIGESIEPNQFFFWNPKYGLVLELPEGTIKQTKTEIGDVLVIS